MYTDSTDCTCARRLPYSIIMANYEWSTKLVGGAGDLLIIMII
jgi:hypothetical protein